MSNELRRSNSFFDLLSDTGSLFQNRFFQEIKMDVHETEDNYQVTADLPGYAKEDITVDYENDILSISATRKSEKVDKDEKGQIIRQERSSGSVHREIYLKYLLQMASRFKIDVLEKNAFFTHRKYKK